METKQLLAIAKKIHLNKKHVECEPSNYYHLSDNTFWLTNGHIMITGMGDNLPDSIPGFADLPPDKFNAVLPDVSFFDQAADLDTSQVKDILRGIKYLSPVCKSDKFKPIALDHDTLWTKSTLPDISARYRLDVPLPVDIGLNASLLKLALSLISGGVVYFKDRLSTLMLQSSDYIIAIMPLNLDKVFNA